MCYFETKSRPSLEGFLRLVTTLNTGTKILKRARRFILVMVSEPLEPVAEELLHPVIDRKQDSSERHGHISSNLFMLQDPNIQLCYEYNRELAYGLR